MPKNQDLANYGLLLTDIKGRIQAAQTRAAVAVNAELIKLYWDIGQMLDARQAEEGWGAAVIPRLAADIVNELPEVKGFSERNLKRMLAFYREYASAPGLVPQPVALQRAPGKVPQAVAQSASEFPADLLCALPWGHHLLLIEKVKDHTARVWYMARSIAEGWSRSTLGLMISGKAHAREGRAANNFDMCLPPPQSDMARQTLKDPYLFDFLTLDETFRERELERGEFKPEYAGKMNFYCNLVDDQLRHKEDAPTIGLVLCQEHNRVLAEYALRGMDKPIGVSSFELTRALPTTLQSVLPSIETIEAELNAATDSPDA